MPGQTTKPRGAIYSANPRLFCTPYPLENSNMPFRYCKKCVNYTPHDDNGNSLKCHSCGLETPR